jgi:hypothetical protein
MVIRLFVIGFIIYLNKFIALIDINYSGGNSEN